MGRYEGQVIRDDLPAVSEPLVSLDLKSRGGGGGG